MTVAPAFAVARVVVSDWITVSQEMIDKFAEATGDAQWIHVDRERSARESPYGTTVAHGFLTLSLMPKLLRKAFPFDDAGMSINYGLNRVRFISPVTAGSRIRGKFEIVSVSEEKDASKVVWSATIERESAGKPCCVAEWIVLYTKQKAESRKQK
ncbi:MAG: MaoC family dehydratase [Thermoanaerobaculia bacterium]